MTASASQCVSWCPSPVRFKLVPAALAAAAIAWAIGPAHAVTFTVQNIIDPLNPTFTQALGINDTSTIVGYGNATVFNGFQLILPATFTRQNVPGADGGTQVVGISGAGTTVGFSITGGVTSGFAQNGGVFTPRQSARHGLQPASRHQQIGHDCIRVFLHDGGRRRAAEGADGHRRAVLRKSDFHRHQRAAAG
jgi:hypothetical protein